MFDEDETSVSGPMIWGITGMIDSNNIFFIQCIHKVVLWIMNIQNTIQRFHRSANSNGPSLVQVFVKCFRNKRLNERLAQDVCLESIY